MIEPKHAVNIGMLMADNHPVIAYAMVRAYCELNDLDWREALELMVEAKEVFHDSTISMRQLREGVRD